MKRWFCNLYVSATRMVLKQWVPESRAQFDSYNIDGFEVVGPGPCVRTVELTLPALQQAYPAEYGLVKEQIRTIYFHPHAMGFLGFGNNCVFVSTEYDLGDGIIWGGLASHLVGLAEINKRVSLNKPGILFRWSGSRRQLHRLEREITQRIDGITSEEVSAPQF